MATGPESRRVIRFGVFEVDLAAAELRKKGLKLKLQDQPFRVLALLLERQGEIVTREELREKLWPADTFVEFDHSLNTAINKIREVLGDSADSPRFVETVPRRGYRFLAPVEALGEDATAPAIVAVQARRPVRKAAIAGIAAAALVAVGLLAGLWVGSREPAHPGRGRVVKFSYTPDQPNLLAISPDGRHIAYIAGSGEVLEVQDLDRDQPRRIAEGTENAMYPFWSPDSSFLGFGAGGKLKKVSVHGVRLFRSAM